MQNVTRIEDDFKAFAPTASFQMLVSPIALGISALDLHGLNNKDKAARLRRAANALMDIALKLDERS